MIATRCEMGSAKVGAVCRCQASRVEVLFITDQLCELGGAERVLLRLVNGLPKYGYSPRILTFDIDNQLGIRELAPVPLYVLPLKRTYDRNAFHVARQIRTIVHNHNIQITHTFHETSDLWAGPIAKLSGCRILISSRRDMGFLRQRKHRLAYRLLAPYFTQVQTVSEKVRQQSIQADHLPPTRVVTIYNGVDIPTHRCVQPSTLRQRFGLPQNGPVITTVGHIRRVKGLDVFARAAARVVESIRDATFVIAGDDSEPEYADELRALVRELNLQHRFVFLGGISDVNSLLQASDVFCLLSRTEGLSNALLEAMSCELPAIATRVGGNPELIVSGTTGLLVESDDPAGAASAIMSLLNNGATARRMGFEARRRVEEHFATEVMIRRITESYEQLLGAARTRP